MKSIQFRQQKENGNRQRIGRKVGNLVAAMLGLSIVIVVVLCISIFYNLVMNMLEEQCVNGTNTLAYELQDYSGPEDKTQLLDDLKQQLDCEFTIFNGDERAYTTILQDGQRAVGTKLSDELASIVLQQGQAYVGTAEILGVDHLCSYVPTKDADGTVNGLIFAGISTESAAQQVRTAVIAACAAGIVLIVLCLLLLSVFIKRFVSWPLKKLTNLAQVMEQGNLGLRSDEVMTIDIHSNDEIGLLAEIFESTILRLKNYIGEISTILASISEGNLSVETTQNYVGDFTSIKVSLDDILQKLNKTMSQILESSDQVANHSEQMSTAAQALGQGSMQQSQSVEQLESTIRDVSDHVEETAERARLARTEVSHVGKQITDSNDKMQQMIDAMQEITDSSREIGKIIKTIEDIAFQTNVLALNAAVEAARAGTAGKGFAVVADEVRNLASKSSEASQSTTALTERSIQAVEHGMKIAGETAERLASVVEGANTVVEAMNGIADAATSQAESVSQIRDQASQISNVVHTNSATAQETAAASQELSSQAGLLKRLMDTFRLKQ